MTITESVVATRTLTDVRQSVGLSRGELAELSGISYGTICSIENGSSAYNTHRGVAWALADALYVPVDSICWPRELVHIGRPPHTGKELMLLPEYDPSQFCDDCHLLLPLVGVCGNH